MPKTILWTIHQTRWLLVHNLFRYLTSISSSLSRDAQRFDEQHASIGGGLWLWSQQLCLFKQTSEPSLLTVIACQGCTEIRWATHKQRWRSVAVKPAALPLQANQWVFTAHCHRLPRKGGTWSATSKSSAQHVHMICTSLGINNLQGTEKLASISSSWHQ